MALLSLLVAAYAAFHVATGFVHLADGVAQNGFISPLGLQVHIGASAVALAIGPFQFLPWIRMRARAVHRWMGRVYVAACFAGGAAGGAIAMFTTAGPVAGLGFFLLAVFWLIFTALALRAALKRDFATHERFMIRSFALTLAAVTLRIYLPIGASLSPDDFILPYTIIAWVSWVPNLVIAEMWLAAKTRRRGLATA